MSTRSLIFAFLLSASLAFGQLDSNSITVTVSRSATLQPDQIAFNINVKSGLNTNLDEIVSALSAADVTAANFSGLYSFPDISFVVGPGLALQPTVTWTFTLPTPLSKIKDTAAMLTNLQKTIASNNSGLSLSFSVAGLQVSPQLQQSQTCSIPGLLSDARAKAQTYADAAGLSLGAPLAFSTVAGNATAAIPGLTTSAAPPCTLTVKFAASGIS